MTRDSFTSTVDGAAAFERWHHEPEPVDVPSPSELADLGGWSPQRISSDDEWARAVAEASARAAAGFVSSEEPPF